MKEKNSNLKEYTLKDIRKEYSQRKFSLLNPILKAGIRVWRRLTGEFSFEDSIRIATVCEPPVFF